MEGDRAAPLLRAKAHADRSIFLPENLLREARRQKGLPPVVVPPVCVLDPDGDIADALARSERARRETAWACYHTDLWVTRLEGREVGVVGRAVGAPFAVMVAEELFATGCELLISVSSAGRIGGDADSPPFVAIERAWRDEGTSLHYLPPGEWAGIDPGLAIRLGNPFQGIEQRGRWGSTWTTDAPFRETSRAVAEAAAAGAIAVEMEAAALYAFAAARSRAVVCVAHITNTMAVAGDDFDKGHDNGVDASLSVVSALIAQLSAPTPAPERSLVASFGGDGRDPS